MPPEWYQRSVAGVYALARSAALPLLLTACGTPELYSSSVWKLRYDGPQTPASIQVSDPQMYPRHALLNERRDEAEYLDSLLQASRTITFKPQLVRDIETVRALSLALGLSFDAGLKSTTRLTADKDSLTQQIELDNLRGQLLQTQRDLELLKAKLKDQATPSSTFPAATTAATASSGATSPSVPSLADTATLVARLDSTISNLIARMDKEYTALVQVSNADAPRELFQDRQALRRDYQSAKNSNSLDVLHDLGPNSLFRMQFRATVLPGDGSEALGVLQMEIERPHYADGAIQNELQPLYYQWLDYLTERMNRVMPDLSLAPDPIVVQLGREERMFAIVPFTFPKPTEATNDADGDGKAALAKEDGHKGLVISPSDIIVSRSKRRKLSARGLEVPKPAQKQKAPVPASTPACAFGVEVDDTLNCDTVLVAFPASFSLDQVRALERYVNVAKDADAWTKRFLALARPGDPNAPVNPATCATVYKDALPLLDYYRAQSHLIRLQRAYAWVASKFGDGDAGVEHIVRTKNRDITRNLQATQRLTEAYYHSICAPDNAAPAEAIVPAAFISALFVKDTDWVAKGRVATYAVSPVALAQQVSTAARAADALQLAASLAASMPMQGIGVNTGMGYMRSVTGKADTVERVPLVVGYSSAAQVNEMGASSEQARFGWLLGPNVVLDTKEKALRLEHNLAPYDLTADISMPAWWPYVTIVSDSAWSPNWRDKQHQVMVKAAGSQQRRSKVPMRQSRSDMDGLTDFVMKGDVFSANNSQVGLKIDGPKIVVVEPSQVSDCVASSTLIVTGQGLWRAEVAYLGGIKAQALAVLPDMGGLSLTFDISSLQPGIGSANLVVPTPDGHAQKLVKIVGNRNGGVNCAVDSPDDGSPFIAAAYPARIFACESPQRIVLKGRNLEQIESAFLGTLPLTVGTPEHANPEVLELMLAKPVGTHGGSELKLPLIIRTLRKGIAVTDIGIERSACDSALETGLTLIEGAAGKFDVCGADSSLVIAGNQARSIDAARLVSSVPAFDISARAVKYSPQSKMTEVGFVGIPKSKITGPELLASPLKLHLSQQDQEVAVLDVPTVCGSYK